MRTALKWLTSSIYLSSAPSYRRVCPCSVPPALLLASFEARDVDVHRAQRVGRRDVLDERDALLLLVQHLDGQPEALQLLHEHLERLRHARLEDVLALHDGLVGLH